jgi:hypothetical protein
MNLKTKKDSSILVINCSIVHWSISNPQMLFYFISLSFFKWPYLGQLQILFCALKTRKVCSKKNSNWPLQITRYPWYITLLHLGIDFSFQNYLIEKSIHGIYRRGPLVVAIDNEFSIIFFQIFTMIFHVWWGSLGHKFEV